MVYDRFSFQLSFNLLVYLNRCWWYICIYKEHWLLIFISFERAFCDVHVSMHESRYLRVGKITKQIKHLIFKKNVDKKGRFFIFLLKRIIYVLQCPRCKAVFHKQCKIERQCPRCLRRRSRRQIPEDSVEHAQTNADLNPLFWKVSWHDIYTALEWFARVLKFSLRNLIFKIV